MLNFKSFNEEDYLDANPDVKKAVSEGYFSSGLNHYVKHGKKEKRPLKKSLTRFDKVFFKLDKMGLGLEIGPSHNPIAPKKDGFNVHILDHLPAEQLREKYKGHEGHGVILENIEEVDYVWNGEPFSELIGQTDCYDWIIASHVIEHVPDMISFLRQCSDILKKDGKISLVIPDKRYCFDYFSPLSSTGNFLDAYLEKRTRPSPGQVFDHFSNAAKRYGKIAWSYDGLGEANELLQTFHDAEAWYQKTKDTADYVDVHCSRFTPSSFLLIVSDLFNLGLINLEVISFFGTEGCEFYITLGKADKSKKGVTGQTRLVLLKEINKEINLANGFPWTRSILITWFRKFFKKRLL